MAYNFIVAANIAELRKYEAENPVETYSVSKVQWLE